VKVGTVQAMLDVIAFDADDTLWHNETLYTATQDRFKQLLSGYRGTDGIDQVLHETEMRNLQHYGYGIKSFALSMIETAIELTDGRVRGTEIREIIGFAREMLKAPVQLLEGVEEVIHTLSESHQLMIITKGDLFDQESKIVRSGLAEYFTHVEIVSQKTEDTYKTLQTKHNIHPERFLMVGNSLKSDILPVLAVGGQAVYIPYHTTWTHEVVADPDEGPKGYFELTNIGFLPALVQSHQFNSRGERWGNYPTTKGPGTTGR
jgi:putative hydrolase of the HAD superfamily